MRQFADGSRVLKDSYGSPLVETVGEDSRVVRAAPTDL